MIRTLNIVALIIAICWMLYSKFDFEPTIATLTLTATLIGQSIFRKSTNQVKINGSGNTIIQKNNNKNDVSESSEYQNKAHVNGDDNIISQENEHL